MRLFSSHSADVNLLKNGVLGNLQMALDAASVGAISSDAPSRTGLVPICRYCGSDVLGESDRQLGNYQLINRAGHRRRLAFFVALKLLLAT
jgi:hypothetical protein